MIPTQRANPLFLPCFCPHNFPTKQNMFTPSTVYQGLQSCLEPLLLDPTVLMHQLVPSKQPLSFPWPHKLPEPPRAENSKNSPVPKTFDSNRNGEESFNCWDFMQPVTNPPHNSRKSIDEPEGVYVHPLSKRSSSYLSTKSLEMCTESLGSETGCGIGLRTDEFAYHASKEQSSKQTKTREMIKKVKQISSFPPPLTSIRGSERVQVQTHREGGRLVIKAFSFSSRSSCFQAERENGRLRLSLMKDGERERERKSENDEEVEQENVDDAQNDCDEESDDEGEMKGCFWEENMKQGGGRVGCKIGGGGGGEWSSSSRCIGDRSSRKRLQSLQCCVAIS